MQALLTEAQSGLSFPCGTTIVAMHQSPRTTLETVNCGDNVGKDTTELCQQCYDRYQEVMTRNHKESFDIESNNEANCTESSNPFQKVMNAIKTHPRVAVGLRP